MAENWSQSPMKPSKLATSQKTSKIYSTLQTPSAFIGTGRKTSSVMSLIECTQKKFFFSIFDLGLSFYMAAVKLAENKDFCYI